MQSLCVVVPNESDVAAFKDYVPPSADSPAAPAPAVSTPPPTPAPTPVAVDTSPKSGDRILATPYAKKLASDQGIDLSVSVDKSKV